MDFYWDISNHYELHVIDSIQICSAAYFMKIQNISLLTTFYPDLPTSSNDSFKE